MPTCDRHETHLGEAVDAPHEVKVGSSIWRLCDECKTGMHNWFGSLGLEPDDYSGDLSEYSGDADAFGSNTTDELTVAKLLAPHARHSASCDRAVRMIDGEPASDRCTCGYADALRQTLDIVSAARGD